MDFFGDFGLRDTFQERIALKPIEINIDKLRMNFLALNVDFDSLSLDFYTRKQDASRVFAIVWAFVRPSVCHTRDLYLNGAS